MKSKITLVLTLCFTFLFSGVASNNVTYADVVNDNSENYILVDKDGKPAIYNKTDDTFIVEAFNLDGSEVSLEEYRNLLNDSLDYSKKNILAGSSPFQDQSVTPLSYINMDFYTESNNYNSLGTPLKMTPDIDCKYSATHCTINKADGKTTTESYSSNVTGGDKNYIKMGAYFTWSTSATVTYSYGWSIPKGEIGYLQFTPRYKVSVGTITYAGIFNGVYERLGTKDVWGQSPIKLSSGEADGIWGIVLK
ncbi:hypothetical protein [Paenibacillus lautus]|uniref:hypothetical protein n=1 Tax=Paenibacillus lautus TaxID=1401 RepID=UPI001C7D6BA1|nr:hypothetical protein [Paenibacillus lautus]MBX4152324.1 hypothetical protein [Paenibacillus lautus]